MLRVNEAKKGHIDVFILLLIKKKKIKSKWKYGGMGAESVDLGVICGLDFLS